MTPFPTNNKNNKTMFDLINARNMSDEELFNKIMLLRRNAAYSSSMGHTTMLESQQLYMAILEEEREKRELSKTTIQQVEKNKRDKIPEKYPLNFGEVSSDDTEI